MIRPGCRRTPVAPIRIRVVRVRLAGKVTRILRRIGRVSLLRLQWVGWSRRLRLGDIGHVCFQYALAAGVTDYRDEEEYEDKDPNCDSDSGAGTESIFAHTVTKAGTGLPLPEMRYLITQLVEITISFRVDNCGQQRNY
jgi:hypothetical protein